MRTSLENISRPASVAGVEVRFLSEGGSCINYVILKKEKQRITTIASANDLKSVEELAAVLDKQIPLVLLLGGKGILTKLVSIASGDNEQTVLNKMLPNASLAELSTQFKMNSEQEVQVSVIRNTVLNELLSSFEKNGLNSIVGCNLGNTDLISATGNYFSGTAKGVLNNSLLSGIEDNYKEKQWFRIKAMTILTATFFVLVLNYFLFGHYRQKFNEQNSSIALNQGTLEKYEKLKASVEEKKLFLEQNGFLGKAQTSWYADNLAAMLPAAVSWTNVSIHPVKKKPAEEATGSFQFGNKSIRLAGRCSKSTELNQWMKQIRELSWVQQVALLNYTQDNARDAGNFMIGITLR